MMTKRPVKMKSFPCANVLNLNDTWLLNGFIRVKNDIRQPMKMFTEGYSSQFMSAIV